MARFDVTNYIKVDIRTESSKATEILEWLRANVGPYDEDWLVKTRLTPEQVTNYAIGVNWTLNVVAESEPNTRGFNLRWVLEIMDDIAAMQFKLIWPLSKLK
jgi:hypothetical protein